MNKLVNLPPVLAVAIAAYFIGRDKQEMKVSLRSVSANHTEYIVRKNNKYVWNKDAAIEAIYKALPKGWTFSATSGTFWFKRTKGGTIQVDDNVWPKARVLKKKAAK